MAAIDLYEQRLRGLTAREARVLVLLLDGRVSTRDLADVLGSTTAAVQTIRQSIRRKLAIPRNGDLAHFFDAMPALRDVAVRLTPPAPSAPARERRTNLVLRATMRELDDTASRVRAKAGALASLAGDASGAEQDAMLAEAALVDRIAGDLDELRSRALTLARAGT